MLEDQCIISLGNAFEGLNLVGPFEDSKAAAEFAEKYLDGEDWRVVSLSSPLDFLAIILPAS